MGKINMFESSHTCGAGEGMTEQSRVQEDAPQKNVKLMKVFLCTQPVHREVAAPRHLPKA